jgi:hypothetical protein
MAEIIRVTTPAVPEVNTDYQVVYLELDWDHPRIVVKLRADDGKRVAHNYLGLTALTLMRQLNVANLSVMSLHRRIINRLIADGIIGGVVSGVPD